MTDSLKFEFHHVQVQPSPSEPEWSHLVDRWYQLDRAAYLLAETYWQLREQLKTPPKLILLASAAASNMTDIEFVQGGATSASKFVHTLPSVRGTSLYQIMNWSGPMLCLQHGDRTLLSALSEAMDEFVEEPKEIWVMSVVGDQNVYFFRLSDQIHCQWRASRLATKEQSCEQIDSDLVDWLKHPLSGSFQWCDAFWERKFHADHV